jgi:formate hydrogenlyase subunit 3/multisubunit Na+/H+ antiporter MnhD subunit
MCLFLTAVAVLLGGGTLCLLAGRNAKFACFMGPATAAIGGLLALGEAVGVLVHGQAAWFYTAWPVPLGSLSLKLDALSAVFVAPIALVSALAAIYGGQYLAGYVGRRKLGPAWFFYNLLVASMLLVVVASNGLLFLFAWEMMTLASFLLVMFENEQPEVCRAGWTYLVASHLGTAFLFGLFALLGREAESLDFATFTVAPELAGVAFLLAVIGFGTKAGFMPLHVWLPEAHPAAPSHVSAVMSGVMIKVGIYGLVRTLTFVGPPAIWWGWLLVSIGVVSGILGVTFALAQHDLKRLLAYSSVENIGIIALSLGLGLLGVSYQNPAMAALGFAGALVHMVNHALFKSLLFLGAGAVLHATGTRTIDQLGGLLKRMPMTGTLFVLGAAAISGLPPLNGFVGEWLVYLAAFRGLATSTPAQPTWPLANILTMPLASILAIGALALIGGLAAACFTKAFGMVFLGEPRTERASHAHEAGRAMCGPMLVLAAACVLVGLGGWLLLPTIGVAAESLIPEQLAPALTTGQHVKTLHEASAPQGLPRDAVREALVGAQHSLMLVALGSLLVVVFIAGLVLVRKRLLAGREVGKSGTWDCGYAAPTARIQYTGSSFAQPVTSFFHLFLQTRREIRTPEGLFPTEARLRTETPDVFHQRLLTPVFVILGWVAMKLHRLQHGRMQLYVLYVALTLLVLLTWKLGK